MGVHVSRLVVRSTTCSRCKEEVGPGATWCPHCGRDFTEHSPVEALRPLQFDRDRRIGAVGHALGIGALAGLLFVTVDVTLFAAAFRAGLLVWIFTMLAVLFALSEFVVPASPAVHARQSELSPLSRSRSGDGDSWALPSPIQALVVTTPIVAGITAVAFVEGLVSW